MAKKDTASNVEAIPIGLKIIETKKLSWRDLVAFQPKGFKIGPTEGLRKSIANNELIDRFKVFRIPGSKKHFIFDGHTRQQVMLEMEADGHYAFPHELECDVLEFVDKKTAALVLLEYQSGKLKISEIGLIEFAESVKYDPEEMMVVTQDFGLDVIHDKGMSDEEVSQYFTEDDGSGSDNKKQKIILEYTDEDFTKVNEAFEKIGGSKEDIVFKLLKCK
ncbi:MAG: hypothetical protein IPO78_17145 [Saprospiraceae bacterium]|nr:hypothetical protein [Saprospiraceae bacterium]